MKERTLIILKPGCLQRGIAGEIISRFEKKGFKIVGLRIDKISLEEAAEHYKEHVGKPFYDDLVNHITSGPVILMVLEGDKAIVLARKLTGPVGIENAEPGTIRGDFCMVTQKNLVHSSDSKESAEREISLFFKNESLLEYQRSFDNWVS